ncbi:hypothetical protein D9M69_518620 [compost metagenome]
MAGFNCVASDLGDIQLQRIYPLIHPDDGVIAFRQGFAQLLEPLQSPLHAIGEAGVDLRLMSRSLPSKPVVQARKEGSSPCDIALVLASYVDTVGEIDNELFRQASEQLADFRMLVQCVGITHATASSIEGWTSFLSSSLSLWIAGTLRLRPASR